MTKGSGRRSRSKLQQLGAEALTELKEGRSPGRPDWSDRRPLRFWQPFNDWWRSELERLGRRPNAQEIHGWYNIHAYTLWKDDAPTLQETRIHAKCLRSLPLVRDYFRNYRAKKRSTGDRSGGMMSGDELEYKEEDDDMGDLGPEHFHDGHMDGDMDGADVDAGDADVDGDGYIGRGGSAAAAAAAAGLTQLANLRANGSPSGSMPLELLHPALPALPAILSPAAAGLWSTAAAAQQLDPGQPHDLLRSITLQQLQHAAAMQQQLALAAIAQNFAMSRAAGIGMQALSQQAAASQQQAMIKVLEEEEEAHSLEERFRICEEMARGGGREPLLGGSGAAGAADCLEHIDHPAAALGRGKRKRTERRLDIDSDTGLREAVGDMVARPGPSGRGGGGGGYARRMQHPAAARHRRGARGASLAVKQSTTKRQPAGASCAPEMAGGGDEDGGMGLAYLHRLQVPAGLGMAALPRDALLTLSHEQLVERVLVLQAHLQLLAAQQQQDVLTPQLRDEEPLLSPQHQHRREQPKEERSPAPTEETRARRGSHAGWQQLEAQQGPEEEQLEAVQQHQQQYPQPVEVEAEFAAAPVTDDTDAVADASDPAAAQQVAAAEGGSSGGRGGGGAGDPAPSDGDSGLPDLVVLPDMTAT